MSKPLQVYLDAADLDKLESWSRERGWTKSQTVRAAIRALTRAEASQDPLLGASGMIDGLPADLSERFDAYIEATFVAERSPGYRGQPKKRPRTRR